ncbi:hypothetical protein Dhaf_4008 [Desulfitobacterium hafniense DCB-2]|uniref:Uncharacterized protein n=2 Tax=root TaxID=1 RepID=B8FT02_DESHD|nr:hypothetical protein [Desulfitobacterium hafniense]ACL22018.1 hypothetical protein Dhaf_4008 [Desulfitobacterium hafniense DCB-2]MEA5022392.1 hypothetical protein [Desulfitobacterium hafniense]
MEKIIEFNINQKIFDLIRRRIKTKSQLIELLIEVSSLIIVNIPLRDNGFGKISINLDNMKRCFFSIQNSDSYICKHFTFNFPFRISEENGIYQLETFNGGIMIKSSHIAILRSICSNGAFDERECRHGLLLDFSQLIELTLIDLNLDIKSYERDLNQILMELFTFEPSYIRYDYDEKNEDGKIHPLNHLDIFYSQSTSFKLGCERLELKEFMDILNTGTECSYIK